MLALLLLQQVPPKVDPLWLEVLALSPEQKVAELERYEREKPFWDNSWLGEVDPDALNAPLPSEKRGNGRRYGDPLYEKFGDTWKLIGYEDIAPASEVIPTSNNVVKLLRTIHPPQSN